MNESSASAAPAPPSFRPLTGVEDLTVFYGLTKTYKRYARDTPPTYEHLIAHLPGPPLYSPHSTHTADKQSTLLPLSYPPTLPPPLQARPVTQQQADTVLTFTLPGELGVVRQEMQHKAERMQRLAEERSRRKLDKRVKKGDKRRKVADGTLDSGEDGNSKRLKLDGGGSTAMIDIS